MARQVMNMYHTSLRYSEKYCVANFICAPMVKYEMLGLATKYGVSNV